MQGQERASKIWNTMKESPSDYLALVAKLEKRIPPRKLRNTAVWRSFVKKSTKKYRKPN